MGSLRKKRKREQSKASFKKKQSQSRPQQGGRFRSASSSNNLRNSPLITDNPNLEKVKQIRLQRAGLSKSDIQRQLDSARSLARKQKQIQSQAATSLEAQTAAQQGKIKATQLARKNEKILRELEAIRQAEKTLSLTNTPQSQKVKLRQNFAQKRSELQNQLKRNQTNQLRQLGTTQAEIRNAQVERTIQQRRQKAEQLEFQLKQLQAQAARIRTDSPQADSLNTTSGNQRQIRNVLAQIEENNLQLSRAQDALDQQQSEVIEGPADQPFAKGPIGSLGFVVDTNQISKQNTPQGKTDSEKFVEGLVAPIENIVIETEDFFRAVEKGPEGFKDQPKGTPGNLLGIPVPKNQRPLKDTATSQIFSGKLPDLTDPSISGSAVSELLLLLAPAKAAKVSKPQTKTTSTTTSKTVRPQTSVPVAEQLNIRAPVPIPKTSKNSFSKQTVPLGTGVTKTPSIFASETLSLGKGLGRLPKGNDGPSGFGLGIGKGGGPKPGPKTKPGNTPKDPGERTLSTGGGLLQVQKTKPVTSRTFQSQRVSLGAGRQVKPKTKTRTATTPKLSAAQKKRTKTIAQQRTENFFLLQERAAKKRQKAAIAIINPFAQRSGSKTLTKQPQPRKQSQRTGLKTQPKLTQRQKRSQLFRTPFSPVVTQGSLFVTPTTTTTITRPIREPRVPVGRAPIFPLGFNFGGLTDDPTGGKVKTSKRFIASSLDEFRPGVIATAGVKEISVGRKSSIFGRVDKQIAKARQRQEKKSKVSSKDPLESFIDFTFKL